MALATDFHWKLRKDTVKVSQERVLLKSFKMVQDRADSLATELARVTANLECIKEQKKALEKFFIEDKAWMDA